METRNIQSPNSPESRKAGDPLELSLCGVKAIFRYCPPGTFIMGSLQNDAIWDGAVDPHKVKLKRGFWLLETPVTQAIWKAVTGENPSDFQGMDARPVEKVSWNDCNDFICKLNNAEIAPDCMKFAFPTNEEWEYACRAGTKTRYNCGDELTESDANFDEIFGVTTPVKSFAPNAWGFYDMHGNVCEWCAERRSDLGSYWDSYWGFSGFLTPLEYQKAPRSGSLRVLRGGGWLNSAASCRSAALDHNNRSHKDCNVGFRLALRTLS